jgi:hypothetical protein
MKNYIFCLTIFIFGYSYGMDKTESTIGKMDSQQLGTFIREKGGYAKLSASELALVNFRKRALNAANWDLPGAINFLRGKKNHCRIIAEEWDALCNVMGKNKDEIIAIYFPSIVPVFTKKPAAIMAEPLKLTLPTVIEIDLWTARQAGNFMVQVKNPREVPEEIWQALARAAARPE